mmetsp:Transcript_106364/g.216917  ORF Transcript_106364/g.216917 Transcript_106364/m.216917 type:complete len:1248 (+) Transcript_106364:328-4071(+)
MDESFANETQIPDIFAANETQSPSFFGNETGDDVFDVTTSAADGFAASQTGPTLGDVIGTPMLLGMASLMVCTAFFAVVIHLGWIDDLSPRIANRPKEITKNSLFHDLDPSLRNTIYYYPVAFILWAYNLTYRQILKGLPGTGTRKNGREGPLLKANLDAIILLKYHTLLFKVSVLVAFLCVVFLIPINTTAKCDRVVFGFVTCSQHNATNVGFYSTTIGNIPNKIYNNDRKELSDFEVGINSNVILSVFKRDNPQTNLTLANGTVVSTSDDLRSMANEFWVSDQTWRVYATLICCLLIYGYTMYLLTCEWVENVTLRREFFLEASVYAERMTELNKLEFDFVKKSSSDRRRYSDHAYADPLVESNDHGRLNRNDQETIAPYLTHPEIRETPPSIGLYSVLYRLPNSMITYGTDGATSLERQLVATTKFFDEVVPAQPGFSSSVVAVTMLPKAKLVAKTWTKWNACELKMRSLRNIQKLIANEEGNNNYFIKQNQTKSPSDEGENAKPTTELGVEENISSPIVVVTNASIDEEEGLESGLEITNANTESFSDGIENHAESMTEAMASIEKNEMFKYVEFDVVKYAKSLGFHHEVTMMKEFVHGMGIEEFNVFAREAAILAGGPTVFQQHFKFFSLDSLRDKEADLISDLKVAEKELMKARKIVSEDEDDHLMERLRDSIHDRRTKTSNGSDTSRYESKEWTFFAEEEVAELNPILEYETTGKPIGKMERLKHVFKRVFFGADNVGIAPKYYCDEADNHGKAFLTDINHPSCAVVTFSSRHSAIMARQCLADGSVSNSWKQVDDIPTFPLADAPEFIFFPRGIMRPVTPTISYFSKKARRWIVYPFLVIVTGCYLYPINLIQRYVWGTLETKISDSDISDSFLNKAVPTLSGLTETLLFSVCPVIFKLVANFEGSSSSMARAEQQAMLYFWYFYIVARFMGQLVWEGIMKFYSGGASTVEELVTSALQKLAGTVPTKMGPTALTYIIFASTITWPTLYFLQLNNYLTTIFRLGWINRILKGGGPGSEVPYRIYVDSGYVFACMTSLAPLCPLVAPFGLMYFVILSPMLRWLMIFAYRPIFDGGGDKWPQLHHIIVTSLVLGQIITAITFLLKGNVLEGLIIGACIVPTLLYSSVLLERFSRSYRDASLLHTGRMNNAHQEKMLTDSWEEREEFRRWLVDCHKASYLPTCLSGGTSNDLLTAQPAVVIPISATNNNEVDSSKPDPSMRDLLQRQKAQKGGIMRRHRYGI